MLKEISIPLTINDVKKNKALCKKTRTTDAGCTCLIDLMSKGQKTSKANYNVLSSPKKQTLG